MSPRTQRHNCGSPVADTARASGGDGNRSRRAPRMILNQETVVYDTTGEWVGQASRWLPNTPRAASMSRLAAAIRSILRDRLVMACNSVRDLAPDLTTASCKVQLMLRALISVPKPWYWEMRRLSCGKLLTQYDDGGHICTQVPFHIILF